MKALQRLGRKVGVGLVLGVGSLVLAAPTAQADTPCQKDDCTQPAPQDSCTGGPCQPVGRERVGPTCDEENPECEVCLDCDGNCAPDTTYERRYQQFECEGMGDLRCSRIWYVKNVCGET